MNSISEYHALRSMPIAVDEDLLLKRLDLDIQEIIDKEPGERAHIYSWCLGSISHDRISLYISYILAFRVMREEFNVSSSVSIYRWHVTLSDEVFLIKDVVHRVYFWHRSGRVTYKSVSSLELSQYTKPLRSLEILGITGADQKPYAKTSDDLKRWFKEDVLFTLSKLEPTSFESVVWRYEEMNFYPKTDVLYDLLKKEGFRISLEEPYFVLKNGCPLPQQALTLFIDYPLQVREVSSRSHFSISKVQLAIDSCLEKISFLSIKEEQEEETLEEGRKRLKEDIHQIAKIDPLIKRYAFDVSRTLEEAKLSLCQELNDLGYIAFLDTPFICQIGGEILFKQYIIIDLVD